MGLGFAGLLDQGASGSTGCGRVTEKELAVRKRLHSAPTFPGVLVLYLLLLASSLDLCAQSASTGALTGTVTDPTGGVLQNARIALRNTGTEETRTAITGQNGSYRFSLLPPGEYELTVEAPGFAPLVVRRSADPDYGSEEPCRHG